MNKKLKESIFMGDLKGVVSKTFYIDYYEPKVDSDATIVSFVVIDEEPAKDLEKFIDFGPVDVLDTDVSPAPDENGNYHVFIEIMAKNKKQLAKRVFELLETIKYITAQTEWVYNYKGKRGKLVLSQKNIKFKGLV